MAALRWYGLFLDAAAFHFSHIYFTIFTALQHNYFRKGLHTLRSVGSASV
jgi:hypothetical protein